MNGVTTIAQIFASVQWSFTLIRAPPFITITCDTTGEDPKIKKMTELYGGSVMVQCPRNCDKIPIVLYGIK